jgi:septal ring-binding cell division protein DamX
MSYNVGALHKYIPLLTDNVNMVAAMINETNPDIVVEPANPTDPATTRPPETTAAPPATEPAPTEPVTQAPPPETQPAPDPEGGG